MRLLATILLLALGCTNTVPRTADAHAAAVAAINAIDPESTLRIAFGPAVDPKTQRVFNGIRPAAVKTDMDSHLPANVLRIDEFIVEGDTATVKARKGYDRAQWHALACGTGYTITLHKAGHGWIPGPMTIAAC